MPLGVGLETGAGDRAGDLPEPPRGPRGSRSGMSTCQSKVNQNVNQKVGVLLQTYAKVNDVNQSWGVPRGGGRQGR